MAGKTEVFNFKSNTGELLAGRLELPDGDAEAVAIFAHCFTCSKNVAAASRISRALAALGFAVLRFDFTGLGNSEGDFANTSFSSNVEDLEAAARALEEQGLEPRLLVGHSLGGAAVLAAAPRIDGVQAVATIGAPSEPSHVKHLFAGDVPTIDANGRAEVTLAGRQFTIRREFIEDLEAQSLAASLPTMKRALLVFHSPVDDTVSIDHAAKIFQSAKHPKSFVSLDQADHLLSRVEDAEYVADTLGVWAARYLTKAEIAATAQLPAGAVVVDGGSEGYQQRVRTAEHEWLADEPVSVGGAGTGPTPYDLLLAALGTCTNMTLRMYANRKQWPLTRTWTQLRIEKIHAKDCAECETETGKIDRISIDLRLEGDLDSDQRARLLEIAHRCPVHRTLKNEKQIGITVID
ncbi:MAG: bifunctional alpha/beta hydrolase/OsmC family protein [Planctomycetota bacterium]